jgi:hypothetical protein
MFKDKNGDWTEEGTGTLKEYFTQSPWHDDSEAETTDPLITEMAALAEERDDHVDRLLLQLFTEFSNVDPDEQVRVFMCDYGAEANRAWRRHSKKKGLVMVMIHPDDPVFMLYRDGTPISAFYASYRGVYQAGGFVVASGKSYFAHNAFTVEHAGAHNVWHEPGGGCADIARDYLLDLRKPYM